MALFACRSQRPDNLGIHQGRLAPCPPTPNCASTDASDPRHALPPFQLNQPAADVWPQVGQLVQQLPRTVIIKQTGDYLHAECSSAVFGFVDDLELQLRAEEQRIAVRSASRLGHSDFGVNRKRVEQLRALLQQHHIID